MTFSSLDKHHTAINELDLQQSGSTVTFGKRFYWLDEVRRPLAPRSHFQGQTGWECYRKKGVYGRAAGEDNGTPTTNQVEWVGPRVDHPLDEHSCWENGSRVTCGVSSRASINSESRSVWASSSLFLPLSRSLLLWARLIWSFNQKRPRGQTQVQMFRMIEKVSVRTLSGWSWSWSGTQGTRLGVCTLLLSHWTLAAFGTTAVR